VRKKAGSTACAAHVLLRAAKALPLLAFLVLLSCASRSYVRDWIFEGVALTDTLMLFENAFVLERSSALGVSRYAGTFTVHDDEWRFEIDTWKGSQGIVHHFDPPVVYLYRGRIFQNGIAFYSGKAVGETPLTLFIRTPTDFDARD
jgi:hypothetical protein